MSDTAQTVAVPAPAEASPGTATPTPIQDGAAAVQTPAAPTSFREARQSIRDRIAASVRAVETPADTPAEPAAPSDAAAIETPSAAPDPVLDAQGRAHDPATGKFLPSGEAATPEAASAPEGLVRIELPEGHPLRERGRTHYEVRISSPEEEAEIRGLLATPIKQRQLKEAEARVQEMEEKLLRIQAQEAARQKWEQGLTPAHREMLAAVEDVNPGAAALMRRGLESSLPELAEQEFRSLADQRAQAEVQTAAAQFVSRVEAIASTVYAEIAREPYFPELMFRARAAYGAELTAREARGEDSPPDEREFLGYFRSFALQHPQASVVFRQKVAATQQAERERVAAETKAQAEAEAKQREAAQLQAALQKRRTNPLGGVAMGVTTGVQSAPGDARPASAHEARRSLRDRMRTGV